VLVVLDMKSHTLDISIFGNMLVRIGAAGETCNIDDVRVLLHSRKPLHVTVRQHADYLGTERDPP